MKKEHFDCAVTTKRGTHIKEIEDILERNTWTDPEVDNKIIPARKVECINRRPLSKRTTYYKLTRNEIFKLEKDPRILGVDIIPDNSFLPEPEYTTTANFNSYITASSGNPALYFINNATTDMKNLVSYYNSGSIIDDIDLQTYSTSRQGENIDIVIHDSPNQEINWALPDFYDDNGNNRVLPGLFRRIKSFETHLRNEIINTNFNSVSGTPAYLGLESLRIKQAFNAFFVNPKGDSAGHGTAVASVSAGSKFGVARKANIIENVGINATIYDSFDELNIFHVSKSINPLTNKRNPTISIRSVGGNGTTIARWVNTGSLVSASFSLENWFDENNGFRINYAGHDLVFTSGSTTEIDTNYNKKLGGNIYQYSCKSPTTFATYINDSSGSVSSNTDRYTFGNFAKPLSMFSASYNESTQTFTLTSSFGLPSSVRIYTGTLAQLTGSETPSGGNFLIKLTGSEDPSWAIDDWVVNGTPLNLGGKDTYPKNEYGLFIRPYDHHGILNDSTYAWTGIWTSGEFGIQCTNTENALEYRFRKAEDIADDQTAADLGIILVNSGGNKNIAEYKSASTDDPYYRPEYNIPSSHPYNSYYTSTKDVGTILSGSKQYYHRSHNDVSVIDVGNYGTQENFNIPYYNIQPRGNVGNAIEIFAPGALTQCHYESVSTALPEGTDITKTSSLFNTPTFYNQQNLFTNIENGSNSLIPSSHIFSYTESINNILLSLDKFQTTQSLLTYPDTGYSSSYYMDNAITSASLSSDFENIYFHRIISKFGGTSGAAPLVGGVLALYLESNPDANVIDCKNFLRDIANVSGSFEEVDSSDFIYIQDQRYSSSIDNGLVIAHDIYTKNNTTTSILNGAPNRILLNPFNNEHRDLVKVKGINFGGGLTYNNNKIKFT